MDPSLNYQLIGLSLSSRTPPVNQGRFRFPPTADRFIPFRRTSSHDTNLTYSNLEEDTHSKPTTPDSPSSRAFRLRNSIGSGSQDINDNVFSPRDRAIRRQQSVREAQRRSERSSSTNSLDTAYCLARTFSCDESSPKNAKSRVLNFFSPEYKGGRRRSQGN